MRKRERLAAEKREERKECFEEIKMALDVVFTHPVFQPSLEIALRWPSLKEEPEQRKRLINDMVQVKAEYCLSGDPNIGSSAALECKWLVEMVDWLDHVSLVLVRTVKQCRETGEAVPQPLRLWAESLGVPILQKPGPSLHSQDFTATRNFIIAFAICCADWAQNSPYWYCSEKLKVGRGYLEYESREEKWRESFSICRAVAEILEERYVCPSSEYLGQRGLIN